MLHDNYLRVHASRRYQITRAACYIKMAVDPWLMPDLAHFACLMSSVVHVLGCRLCDTAQPRAVFYILSICMLHDTCCVLHDTCCNCGFIFKHVVISRATVKRLRLCGKFACHTLHAHRSVRGYSSATVSPQQSRCFLWGLWLCVCLILQVGLERANSWLQCLTLS